MVKPFRRIWLAAGGAGLAALVVLLVWIFGGFTEQRKNFILIAIDTLRADALGCYGSTRGASPKIDAFSKECVIFDAAYSQAPWTLPSFASLFTSTYPGEHGAHGKFEGDFFPIREGLTNAARSFKDQGYLTAAIVNNIFLMGSLGFKDGFDSYDYAPAELFKNREAEAVSYLANRWLRNNAGEGDPFFLFVHYIDPHFFYMPKNNQKKFGGILTDQIKKITDPTDVREGRVNLDDWDKENLRSLYDGEVHYTDREVGKVLNYLESQDLLENSVVVILSDHGEEFWDHGDFEHGHTQYEELVKVPLIIRIPGRRDAGRRIEWPVRLMDLMPTMHEVLGLVPPATFKGESFLDTILGSGRGYQGPLYFESCLYDRESKALRANNLKLILDMASEEAKLYDIKNDPREQNNLASTRAPELEKLKAALLKLDSDFKSAYGDEDQPLNLPPEVLKRLQDLGYVGGKKK